jgi:hypothetical protein
MIDPIGMPFSLTPTFIKELNAANGNSAPAADIACSTICFDTKN